MKKFVLRLWEIGALRFGTFVLKSGMKSPVYCDLRLLISYPDLLKDAATLLWKKVKKISFAKICAVPYGGLPFAISLSLKYELPMIFCRKEVKKYGTKKPIEGVFRKKEKTLFVEDVVVSGQSLIEMIAKVEKEGLVVKDIITFVDREQGGKEKIESKGYRLHSVFTLKDMITLLAKEKKVGPKKVKEVMEFLQKTGKSHAK